MMSVVQIIRKEARVDLKVVDSKVLEDANVVAYLIMKGHIAIPFISHISDHTARVSWDIQGDVEDTLRGYYSNESVGVRDFVRILKDVRSEMYSTKTMARQLKASS
jgi:hypothetical protein